MSEECCRLCFIAQKRSVLVALRHYFPDMLFYSSKNLSALRKHKVFWEARASILKLFSHSDWLTFVLQHRACDVIGWQLSSRQYTLCCEMSCFDCNAFFPVLFGCKIVVKTANAPLGPAVSSTRPISHTHGKALHISFFLRANVAGYANQKIVWYSPCMHFPGRQSSNKYTVFVLASCSLTNLE